MFNNKLFIFLFGLSLVFVLSSNNTYATSDDPIGWLDSVNTDCNLNGWAVVKDHPTVEVNVEVYLDGPKGTGKLVATIPTDIYRSDVNACLGVSGDHGFAAAVPAIYHDGKTHSIYVYANNTVTVNISVVLSGVPKSCQPSPTPTPTASTSPSPTPTYSPSPTPTNSPTPTPTISVSPTPTPSTSSGPTPTASATPTPTSISGGDTIAPTVSITSPSSGITFSYRIYLVASAQDNVGIVGVRFYREGGVALGLEDGFSPYSMYLYASTLTVGQHTITARARDAAGNVTISGPITVNVVPPPDITPPLISGISVTGITAFAATIQWTTNEPADGQIEFCPIYAHCGTNTPIVSGLTTSHVINLFNLTPGTKYYFWIKSRDAAGNLVTTSTRSFVTALPPDNFPPSVLITAPLNGATVSSRIYITATATDDVGVVGVKFYIDGILIRTEDVYVPYTTYIYTDYYPNGSHVLTAVARDASGKTTTSTPVTINVNNADLVAPYISAISATGITQFAATIQWTTNEAADSQVEFCLSSSRCANNTPIISALTTSHVVNLSGLNPGTTYYYRVKSRDAAGNLSTSFVRSFTTLN